MHRGWLTYIAALLLIGLSHGLPAFGEEETPPPSTVTAEDFQPNSFEEGLTQVETYLRDQSDKSVSTQDRLQQGLKMLDQVWQLDSAAAPKKKLIWMRFSLRMGLAGMGDEKNLDLLAAELKKASEHEDAEVSAEAVNAGLTLEMLLLRQQPPQQRLAVLKEKAQEIKAMETGPLSAKLGMTLVKNLEIVPDKDQAALMTDSLASHFAKSSDESIQKIATDMQGYARRINLKGNTMRVVGKKLDGSDINWASYKGKFVLVDFWATWCGPCISEFPGMKKLYETYHEHGFEIVGISLDDSKSDVEQFIAAREIPWTIICNAHGDDYQGFSDENARYYGINAIPQMIFVGQDGIVIDTEARGERLEELLAEAFPDVEVPQETTETTTTNVVTE
ncbi:TlpA family protein disulfide reductase [Bremerella cremea]|uniref:TlpA family protein disulfide reductase n=1 Tax=Bremerella cremea TaxID=1031537 RepID=A0A368KVT9_9BACT|nr:TlpA disulfide reductase family protein [Bremerella cremea]RCS53002.1 TlpA family protein disulfide reductase [Bremerella cremea]